MSSTWLEEDPRIRAARQATRTVPIVVAIMSDPVVFGFVTSFARPGGSITGLAVQFEDLASKQMQLVKETMPNAARVAILDHSRRIKSWRAEGR